MIDRRTREHSTLTPEQRSQRARLAALSRWASTDDRAAATRPAREAAMARFERQVDPDRKLPEDERARRAETARRAHFQRLAFNRSRATSLA